MRINKLFRAKTTAKHLVLVALVLCLTSVADGINLIPIPTISETVTVPNMPSGPTNNAAAGQSYVYTIKGSSSNLGDPIQYFVDWGDGTDTGWVPISSYITGPDTAYLVNKSWTSPGIYSVKAKARCAVHTATESAWSETLVVTISNAVSISTPSVQGPISGMVNTLYTYTSVVSSNVGFPIGIECKFDWGDGTYSDWSSCQASKAWSSTGVYIVKAQARCCAQNTPVVSDWSDGLSVNIQTSVKNGWTVINLSTIGSLLGLHFTSPNEGWAVGFMQDGERMGGLTFHYLNGSWKKVSLPDVSSNWGLSAVHFISPTEGWAVGIDRAHFLQGLLLHYYNGTWTEVGPPNIDSRVWSLNSVYFTSSSEGWAVGQDESHGRGILFHYLNGVWESLDTPYLSGVWWLYDVNFTSSSEGWAVGWDDTHRVAVLFHYLDGSWTFVSPPKGGTYGLYRVHFTSSNEGWAVGSGSKDVLLHYLNGSWEVISSPLVSSGGSGLNGVHFTSPKEGWTVGVKDYDNHGIVVEKGALLHYLNGSWSEVIPPDVSSYWVLTNVYFPSPDEGWAVGWGALGSDVILLKYSAALVETISTPTIPNGPVSGIVNNPYSYSTGDSSSTLGHLVEYQFDWKGDGSDLSSWGSASQSKVWTTPGTYQVKARARCTIDTSAVSDWSPGLLVTILPCAFSIFPANNTFGKEMGFGMVNVTVNEGCAWSASTTPGSWDWIGISSGWNGAGNGTVNYFLLPNSTGKDRAGTLTIAGKTFTVAQSGSVVGPCNTYAISPTSRNFSKDAGSGAVNVTTDAGCLWSAWTNRESWDWLGITSGWNGTGNGTVDYFLLPNNTGKDRTGTLTVAGKTFTVTQSGVQETISTPNPPMGPTNGTTGTSYSYSTGGSSSNLGNSVEYQFDWKGEGSDLSDWGSATQPKTWAVPDVYNVRARARSASDVSVMSDWSSPLTVRISVPMISVTPAAYDFGNVKVKRNKATSFVVMNSGTTGLSITRSKVTGTDGSMFRITIGGGSKTIKPGKTLTIKIAFKPTSTGPKRANLKITSNDPVTLILDIPLSGTGQ